MLLFEGPSRIISVRRLMDSLWDAPPPSAQSNLRTYKTRLQRELEQARLADRIVQGTRGGGGYGLRAEPSEVDLVAFRDRIASAQRRLRVGEFKAATALFRNALTLWRGPVGDDLPRTRRLDALADGLNGERTAAIEGLSRAAVLSGRYLDAIIELDRYVAEHPTHESAWVLLACAHYLGGNAAVAQATIRRSYRVIADAVGLDPGADLKAAEQAAIQHDNEWFRRYLTGLATPDQRRVAAVVPRW